MFKKIEKSEFKKLLKDPEYTLIDLRSDWEREKYGKIRDNQLHIEYSIVFFKSKLSKLDPTKKYLIYCWHGQRSEVSRDIMQELWFEWVCDLQWGIDEWNK